MNRITATACLLAAAIAVPLGAQTTGDPPGEPAQVTPRATRDDAADAVDLVRNGNEALLAGREVEALEAYRKARQLAPDAPEIDFVEGLAEYRLGQLEEARRHFENAAAANDPQLVDDALYSMGTTYHRQALDESLPPEERISALENAMRQYRSVLENNASHEAARDANYKAATQWRRLKELQQQQQQQQQSSSNEQNEDEKEQQEQEQQQQNQEDKQDEQQDQNEQQDQDQQQQQQEQEQQQQQQQDQDQQEQQQQDQQSSDEQEGDEQESDQQQQSQEQQQQEEEQREAQPDQQEKEDLSREQAERQLREMMEALRDRRKLKREQVAPPPVQPVEKDW